MTRNGHYTQLTLVPTSYSGQWFGPHQMTIAKLKGLETNASYWNGSFVSIRLLTASDVMWTESVGRRWSKSHSEPLGMGLVVKKGGSLLIHSGRTAYVQSWIPAASRAILIAFVHSDEFDYDFAVHWEPVYIFKGGQCLSDYLVCFLSSLISKLPSPWIDEMHGRIHRGRVIMPPLKLLIGEPTR